jgi:hypothetical protein
MQSDLATHKLKLDEKRISHEEVMEAVRQATEKRKRLADTQASEIVALDDKIAEADAALKAEEAGDERARASARRRNVKKGNRLGWAQLKD